MNLSDLQEKMHVLHSDERKELEDITRRAEKLMKAVERAMAPKERPTTKDVPAAQVAAPAAAQEILAAAPEPAAKAKPPEVAPSPKAMESQPSSALVDRDGNLQQSVAATIRALLPKLPRRFAVTEVCTVLGSLGLKVDSTMRNQISTAIIRMSKGHELQRVIIDGSIHYAKKQEAA